jgi:hypothetical protein
MNLKVINLKIKEPTRRAAARAMRCRISANINNAEQCKQVKVSSRDLLAGIMYHTLRAPFLLECTGARCMLPFYS